MQPTAPFDEASQSSRPSTAAARAMPAILSAGMTRAAAVFGRDDWLASAKRAPGFIPGTMWKNGRLFATYKDAQAHLNAYLDEYSYLLAAAETERPPRRRSEAHTSELPALRH